MRHSPFSIVFAAAFCCAINASTSAADKSRLATDDRLFMVRWNDKYGYIDRTGKVVLQPRYDEIASYDSTYMFTPEVIDRRSFSEGVRPVKLGQKWGYIDADEKLVIAATFDMAGPFSGGRAQVVQSEKWGLIDRTGKFTVEPRYSYIGPFEKGWAPVAVGGEGLEGGLPGSKWGLIDPTGKVILDPKYDMVYVLGDSAALANVGGSWKGAYGEVFAGGKWGTVNQQGKFLIEPSISLPSIPEMEAPTTGEPEVWKRPLSLLFSHGLAPIAIDGKWGFIDERGRIAIKPQFDWVGPFAVPPHPETFWWPKLGQYGQAARVKPSNPTSTARAQLKGKFGYIDRSGAWLISPIYDRVGYFSEGLAGVKQGDRFAFINEQGVEAFTIAKGESAEPFWNGLAAVRVGELWGYVDKTGRWVHKPQFDEIRSWTDNLQEVSKNKKWGLIDGTGRLVCPIKYDWFGSFGKGGDAAVGIGPTGNDAAIGLVDRTGRVILEPAFGRDFDLVHTDGVNEQTVFPRRKDSLWGFVDRNGKFVIEPQFENVEVRGEGMIAVRTIGVTGLVDVRSGKLVCPPNYYSIGRFSEGLAEVRVDSMGKIGFLDRKGKVIIPPTWDSVGQFHDGIAAVSLRGSGKLPNHLWIDRSGKYLWEPPTK
jgi:hypothetical protein